MAKIVKIRISKRGLPGIPGGGITWSTLTGKPTAFPPSSHGHAIAEIEGLSEALAAAGGSPSWDTVTGKPTAFTPAAHTHAWSDLTGIPATFAPAAHVHSWADITGKPSTYTPAAHSHAIAEVSGLQAELDGKAAISTIWTLEQIQDAIAAMFQGGTHTNASVTYDDAAGTLSLTASGGGGGSLTPEQVEDMVGDLVVQGTGISVVYDDPNNVLTIALTGESYSTAEKNKLAGIAAGATVNATDAALRDRESHTGTQAISTVTGLQAAIDGKADAAHGHAIADVTGLTAALAGKSDTGHSHAWGEITGKPTTFAPAAHGHAIADTTGLQSALDGKVTGSVTIWTGTQAAYDAIPAKSETTLYFITD